MESELVKRYTYAVTRKLPERQRAEIEKELTGLIEDMLRDRLVDEPATKKDVEAVLLELGSPTVLADKYRGYQRYLIGPATFPTYITILKIVVLAIGIAMAVVFGIQSILAPMQILDNFLSSLNGFIMGCIQAFAWITIIFGLLEYQRGWKEKVGRLEAEKWSPAQLPPLPTEATRITRADTVAGIVFPVIIGVLVTFGISLFGLWVFQHGKPAMVIPFFNAEVFQGYLPFIWLVLAVSVCNETLKLIAGKWTMRLVALDVVVNIIGFALALAMLSNSALWNADFVAQMAQAGLTGANSEAYNTVGTVWGQVVMFLPYFAVVVFALQMIATVVKVLRMKSAAFNDLISLSSID